MDSKTLGYYDDNAERLTRAYNGADVSQLHALLRRVLPVPGRVLEIGCGSGRDALFMASLGCSVVAADGSEQMLEGARRNFNGANAGEITVFHAPFPLPPEHPFLSEKFDAIVAVAMLMHIPNDELMHFARQIGALLKADGVFVCSFCTGSHEAEDGRLYVDREPGDVVRLFENVGFRLLHRETTKDGLGREIAWTTLVLDVEV
jgi:SAM-dependent methyltransferase